VIFVESIGGGETMKKIFLCVIATILVLSITLTPFALAKPSSEKNNPKFEYFLWHTTNPLVTPEGGSTITESKINPPWAVPETPDVKVTHNYGTWALDPLGENYIQIGETQYPIDPETGYEGSLYVQVTNLTPTSTGINYRVYEKIMWGDGNYIEIMANERASSDTSAGPIPIFYASGTINGHGVIDGQNVKISGIREGVIDMGTMTFILDNVGTIQFSG
jgi:hypothetical protein